MHCNLSFPILNSVDGKAVDSFIHWCVLFALKELVYPDYEKIELLFFNVQVTKPSNVYSKYDGSSALSGPVRTGMEYRYFMILSFVQRFPSYSIYVC